MCLLEAAMLLEDGHGTVALVLADEGLPTPLDDHGRYDPLACAYVLQQNPSAESLGRLTNLRRTDSEPETADLPGRMADNPCAGAARLLRRVLQHQPGTVVLGSEPVWCVDLEAAQ